MTDLFNSLQKIMESFSELYTRQATLLQDRFGEVFTYYMNELSSVKEVADMQGRMAGEFVKQEQRLLHRKEQLFAEAKVATWELRPEDVKALDLSKVGNNKVVMFPLMLPRETSEVVAALIAHGYYTNKLLTESRRTDLKNYRTLRKHFKTAGEEFATLMKDVRGES